MAKKTKTPVAEVPAASEQPYYLQRAHIKDFRSIRDAKVEFKPGLNIIIGANGSGKTNFVRVASKGIDFINNEAAGDATEFEINGHQPMKFIYSKSLIKRGFVLLQPGYKNFVKVITNNGEAKGEDLLSTVMENYANIFPIGTPIIFYTLTIVHSLPEVYPIVGGQNEFILDPFSVKDRTGPRLPAYILSAIERYMLNCIMEKSVDSLTPKKLEETIYEIVNFFLSGVAQALDRYTNISDVIISDSLSVYYNKQQNVFTVRGLELLFRTNNEWLPFSALSSGSQRMFYIISELLVPIDDGSFRNSTTRYELEVEKVIFLEEPELGIHPDQLHKLLLFLREQSEKHQLIITTHSPQVLDMLNDDELDRITICELDEKKGTQFRKLKKAHIETAKKFMHTGPGMFLSDYWRYGNLEGTN